jgi:CheY-like chemotaxis protein
MTTQTLLTCDPSSYRVIVIDDEPESLRLVNTLFTKHGISIATFDNVEDGLQAIRDDDYNILLLDLMIPGESNGWELHKQLRQYEKLPIMIVAFTAITERTELARAKTLGFDGFIVKPYAPRTIFRLLSAFVSTYLIWHNYGEPCP